jgi:hypothetical protein
MCTGQQYSNQSYGNAPVNQNLNQWGMPGQNSSLTPGWVPNSQAMFDQNVTAGHGAVPGAPAWLGSLLGLYNMTPQTNSLSNYGRFNWLTGNSGGTSGQDQTPATGPAPGSLPPSIGGGSFTPTPTPTPAPTPAPTPTSVPPSGWTQAPTASGAPRGGAAANWYGTSQAQRDQLAQRNAAIASNQAGSGNWFDSVNKAAGPRPASPAATWQPSSYDEYQSKLGDMRTYAQGQGMAPDALNAYTNRLGYMNLNYGGGDPAAAYKQWMAEQAQQAGNPNMSAPWVSGK